MNHQPTRKPVFEPQDTIPWHQQLRRTQIVLALEAIQDLIAISLCLGLFGVMVLQLKRTFSTLITSSAFHEITADFLFILILVELFRLLIIYLQEQRVSIGVAVEIAIVSVLREVIVNGVLETDWQQILAVCLFLATMALLMVVRVWLPPTFAGVDPEAQVSARMRQAQEQIAAGHSGNGIPRLEQSLAGGDLRNEVDGTVSPRETVSLGSTAMGDG
ncbi:hypothetical protein L107_11615 [Cyanobium sp. Copco_Reservoir_LC18]|uniref:phosphate-starvation-inducible PsiE family protein n=1 Tax=Cyanobium sp. Copco_Reservoir_LC18 TaxID=1328305 RepID=UPI00135CE9D7|nr:phosphate-starvation-inducible PsiE family protein [Cyanobium sp. Copco_Reservoir_LC18]KAF0652797.1 hypothetical protein L107_11615 [Cyanobium sp. Copco_Reservoir_LC18]